MVPSHRFVVAGTDDDAHLVGQTGVLGVVGIKLPIPHGGPQEVTLQAQNEFIYPLIKAMVAIVGAVGVLHPLHEAGPFVVKENATPADTRFAIGIFTPTHIEAVVMLYSHIGPPSPGRDTCLSREFVQSIDSAPAVAAHNKQLTAHLHDKVLLALPLQQVLLNLRQQAINGFGMSQCACNNPSLIGRSGKTAIGLADRLQIGHHIHRSPTHTTLIVGIHINRNLTTGIQQQSTRLGCERNKTLLGTDVTDKHKGNIKQKKSSFNSLFYFHFYHSFEYFDPNIRQKK